MYPVSDLLENIFIPAAIGDLTMDFSILLKSTVAIKYLLHIHLKG